MIIIIILLFILSLLLFFLWANQRQKEGWGAVRRWARRAARRVTRSVSRIVTPVPGRIISRDVAPAPARNISRIVTPVPGNNISRDVAPAPLAESSYDEEVNDAKKKASESQAVKDAQLLVNEAEYIKTQTKEHKNQVLESEGFVKNNLASIEKIKGTLNNLSINSYIT